MRATKETITLSALILATILAACVGTYVETKKAVDEAWKQTLSDANLRLVVRYNEITGEKIVKIEKVGK